MVLTTSNHDRNTADLTYIYPVLSRRSGGLSIGVNLNINNACNWRCIYCQVPNLIRGRAAPVNLEKLGYELRHFLTDVIHGDFYKREEVPEELQVIKDIAISGNGEPTTAREFDQVVNLIKWVLGEHGLLNSIKCVLITNGSMVDRIYVKKGLKKLARINGEIWFKIDSATTAGITNINQIRSSDTSILRRLKIAAEQCPTWIQTCLFEYKNKTPSDTEVDAYVHLIKTVINRQIPVKGLMIYGVERQSQQAEAKHIKKLSENWFQDFAFRLNELPVNIRITP